MIGWLWRMIVGRFGCDHKWEIHREVRVFYAETDRRPTATMFMLRCSACGNMKKKVMAR